MDVQSSERLSISDVELQQLERMARGRTIGRALAVRARIALLAIKGETDAVIARRLEVSPQTVAKWRERFVRERVAGLYDRPRPGKPPAVSRDHIRELIARTLESPPPPGRRRWSVRSLAEATGLGRSTVHRFWREGTAKQSRTRRRPTSVPPWVTPPGAERRPSQPGGW